jgi:hypothetical protein
LYDDIVITDTLEIGVGRARQFMVGYTMLVIGERGRLDLFLLDHKDAVALRSVKGLGTRTVLTHGWIFWYPDLMNEVAVTRIRERLPSFRIGEDQTHFVIDEADQVFVRLGLSD